MPPVRAQQLMSVENSEHWPGRYKTEQILEVSCPKCGAKPRAWCDRAEEKLSRYGRQLLKAGTPPSHQERMWSRQGHAEHEFPALLAKQRPGCWDESMSSQGKPTPRRPNGRADRLARKMVAAPEVTYPRRRTADRICPECSLLVPVEVVVQDPGTIGYRCGQGHMWLASGRQVRG